MDAIEVDDGGTVDAAEDGWIEILLELGYAATQHVSSLSRSEEAHV